MSKTLILTVGLPRSGKSTWALQTGYPVVNRDAIRLALHGQAYIQSAEDMVTAIETYMIKALFLAGHDIVIVDATHTTRVRRDRWESLEWERKFAVFDASAAECVQRAVSGDRDDLVPVIRRMWGNYEPVEEVEGELIQV